MRTLSVSEREVLNVMANHLQNLDRDRLLDQIRNAQVDDSASRATYPQDVAIVVEKAHAQPLSATGVLPVEATVLSDDGIDIGGLLLWATDGWLTSVEFYVDDYGDSRPKEFPCLKSIRNVRTLDSGNR